MSKPANYERLEELYLRALDLQIAGKLTKFAFREILSETIDASGDDFHGIGDFATMAEDESWLDGLWTVTSASLEAEESHAAE
jgi:hypothetical protein